MTNMVMWLEGRSYKRSNSTTSQYSQNSHHSMMIFLYQIHRILVMISPCQCRQEKWGNLVHVSTITSVSHLVLILLGCKSPWMSQLGRLLLNHQIDQDFSKQGSFKSERSGLIFYVFTFQNAKNIHPYLEFFTTTKVGKKKKRKKSFIHTNLLFEMAIKVLLLAGSKTPSADSEGYWQYISRLFFLFGQLDKKRDHSNYRKWFLIDFPPLLNSGWSCNDVLKVWRKRVT